MILLGGLAYWLRTQWNFTLPSRDWQLYCSGSQSICIGCHGIRDTVGMTVSSESGRRGAETKGWDVWSVRWQLVAKLATAWRLSPILASALALYCRPAGSVWMSQSFGDSHLEWSWIDVLINFDSSTPLTKKKKWSRFALFSRRRLS